MTRAQPIHHFPFLVDYLAGTLSSEAEHELELAALQDPEIFEALLAEETELLDTFVQNPTDPALASFARLVDDDPELRARADLAAGLAATTSSPPSGLLPGPKAPTGLRVLGILGALFAIAAVFTISFGSSEPAVSRPFFLVGVLAWFMISSAGLLWVRAHRNARTQLNASLEQTHASLEQAHKNLVGKVDVGIGVDASEARSSSST